MNAQKVRNCDCVNKVRIDWIFIFPITTYEFAIFMRIFAAHWFATLAREEQLKGNQV